MLENNPQHSSAGNQKAEAQQRPDLSGDKARDGGAGVNRAQPFNAELFSEASFQADLAEAVRNAAGLPPTVRWLLMQLLAWDRFRTEVLGTAAPAESAAAGDWPGAQFGVDKPFGWDRRAK